MEFYCNTPKTIPQCIAVLEKSKTRIRSIERVMILQIKKMWYFLLLTKVAFVYSQWYLGEEKQQTTTNIDVEDASKPVPTKSAIQCILKCQRRLRASYFVENTNQCFCVLSKNDKLVSNENGTLNGTFYEQSDLEKCVAKTCEEVKTICPECEPDFYNLEINGEQTKKFCDFDFRTPEEKLSSCLDVCAQTCSSDAYRTDKGCAQMYHCPHGCKMRELGLADLECKSNCQRTINSGCSTIVNGWVFNLCSSCGRDGCSSNMPAITECETGCTSF
eukprot:TCONS_00005600-protein